MSSDFYIVVGIFAKCIDNATTVKNPTKSIHHNTFFAFVFLSFINTSFYWERQFPV